MTSPLERARRRLKLRHLEAFRAVVEAGGIRKAVHLLHMSQPAISKAIAELEEMLGVALVERSRSGVEPTVYGRALMRRSTAVFDELHQSFREIDFLADPTRGELSIGCSETITAGLAAAAIDRLSRRYPNLTFNVESGDAPILQSHFLRERHCELVIARPYASVAEPDMTLEPLFCEQLVVAVGTGNRLARHRKLVLADLMGEPWILSRNEIAEGSPVREAFRAASGCLPTRLTISGSLNLRYGLLADGRFVTAFPHSLLHFAGKRSAIRALPITLPRWQEPTSVITLKNRALSPLAELFIDTVRHLSRPLAGAQTAR